MCLGINFSWNKIRFLLNEMFTLDIRHYVATTLHPKYRSLTFCSSKERAECYNYFRKQLKLINQLFFVLFASFIEKFNKINSKNQFTLFGSLVVSKSAVGS